MGGGGVVLPPRIRPGLNGGDSAAKVDLDENGPTAAISLSTTIPTNTQHDLGSPKTHPLRFQGKMQDRMMIYSTNAKLGFEPWNRRSAQRQRARRRRWVPYPLTRQ